MLSLLDTCIYGVLVDKKHREYENVKKILNYAKTHREQFVTTFIVANELDDMTKELLEVVLPEYYNSFKGVIESLIPEKYPNVKKLAWRYLQKLRIKNAEEVLSDALNYSWMSHADVDIFVTLNRRDLLAEEFRTIIKRINKEMRVGYVKVMTPKEFLRLLNLQTP